MSLKVTRVDVWHAVIEDRPGGLADKLCGLSAAGANLEFVISRRSDRQRGKGVAFATPIKAPKQVRAAKKLGFAKSASMHSLRVEGKDRPGIGAELTCALGDAGINIRGLSAAALNGKFVCHLAFDTAAAAAKAARIARQI